MVGRGGRGESTIMTYTSGHDTPMRRWGGVGKEGESTITTPSPVLSNRLQYWELILIHDASTHLTKSRVMASHAGCLLSTRSPMKWMKTGI